MILLYILVSAQRLIVLDDIGILGENGKRGVAPYAGNMRGRKGRRIRNPSFHPASRGAARMPQRSYVVDPYAENGSQNGAVPERRSPENADMESRTPEEYVASAQVRNVGRETDGGRKYPARGGENRKNHTEPQPGSGQAAGVGGRVDISTPYSSDGTAPPTRIEQDAPQARNEAVPDALAGSGRASGNTERNTEKEKGANGRRVHSRPMRAMSGALGQEDDTSNGDEADLERSMQENMQNANSARSSYLDIKIAESKDRESRAIDEEGKLDEKLEVLGNSLNGARSRAQKTQIDLLSMKNSIKNLEARREASLRAAKKLSAESRILNNEIIRLSREVDEKKTRLGSIEEDIGTQKVRAKAAEDGLIAKNDDVERSELEKSEWNKEIVNIEGKMARMKGKKDGARRERTKESSLQVRLQNEKDKLDAADVVS